MPMTPDEVVKEIEAIENILYSDLNLSEGTKQALLSAITLIQDYQKLREKIEVGKIAGELIEASTFTHTPPNYCNPIKLCFLPSAEIRDIVAQKLVTYLQQPTEH